MRKIKKQVETEIISHGSGKEKKERQIRKINDNKKRHIIKKKLQSCKRVKNNNT